MCDRVATGAISKQFNFRTFPTIFVLDHEGLIRHRDLHDTELKRAVKRLLEKVPD